MSDLASLNHFPCSPIQEKKEDKLLQKLFVTKINRDEFRRQAFFVLKFTYKFFFWLHNISLVICNFTTK